MSEFLPEGEGLRRALQWISQVREQDPGEPLRNLIDQAGKKFDLSPLDEEFLWRTLGAKKP